MRPSDARDTVPNHATPPTGMVPSGGTTTEGASCGEETRLAYEFTASARDSGCRQSRHRLLRQGSVAWTRGRRLQVAASRHAVIWLSFVLCMTSVCCVRLCLALGMREASRIRFHWRGRHASRTTVRAVHPPCSAGWCRAALAREPRAVLVSCRESCDSNKRGLMFVATSCAHGCTSHGTRCTHEHNVRV